MNAAIIIGVVLATVICLVLLLESAAGLMDRAGRAKALEARCRALAADREWQKKRSEQLRRDVVRLQSRLDAADFLRQAGLDEEVDKLLAENAKLRSELAAAERRLDVREKLNLAKEKLGVDEMASCDIDRIGLDAAELLEGLAEAMG